MSKQKVNCAKGTREADLTWAMQYYPLLVRTDG